MITDVLTHAPDYAYYYYANVVTQYMVNQGRPAATPKSLKNSSQLVESSHSDIFSSILKFKLCKNYSAVSSAFWIENELKYL
jgi:hypothetical protein